MQSPTHAIPTNPHTREQTSLLREKALLDRDLAWCHRLYQGLRSPLMSYQPSGCVRPRQSIRR
jgi:hypothetical protein